MLKINRLTIRKLGNVSPGTELRFGPRGIILLGKNGTGKTTLLNLLVHICRCDLLRLSEVDEDYDISFTLSFSNEIEFSVAAKSHRVETNPPTSTSTSTSLAHSEVLSFLQQQTRNQTLRIAALELNSGQRTIIESNDHETTYTLPNGKQTTSPISAASGWRTLAPVVFVPDGGGRTTALWQPFIELLALSNTLKRFDEGLDYFRLLTERGPGSVRIEASKKDGQLQRIDIFETKLISLKCAQRLLDDYNDNEQEGKFPFGLGHSSEIDYLHEFCTLANFEGANIVADLDEKKQADNQETVSLSPLRFSVRRNGSSLHHHHLSFGQCRLLAFLHYHDSNRAVVMADELVNGMHYEWISHCLHSMRNTQAFLSSQNPLLFDFLTFDSAEDVASRFVSCDIGKDHRFIWNNIGDADAIEFYETHKLGLQHASEILRTRGYW